MTTTTTRATYRWIDIIDGGSVLRRDSDGYGIADVQADGVGEWHWRKFGYSTVSPPFGTPREAKAACEAAMGITTKPVQEDQPKSTFDYRPDSARGTVIARCPTCGWLMKDRAEDGCVPGNCSQRPVPKKQADQPEIIVAAEDYNIVITQDKPTPPCRSCGEQNGWHKGGCNTLGGQTHEDAEARHAAAMADKQAENTAASYRINHGKAAKILEIKLGVPVCPNDLWMALELAGEV